MGVTNLWHILSPVQQHKPLSSLKGQTLAVDLSIWVCETQSVKQMQGVVSKPFLRNLFFRISNLVQIGVNLVFVVEGDAPELKWQAMMKRQEVRHQGRQIGKGRSCHGKQTRCNFNCCLRECCEMLEYLGIPYLQSKGEAEAMCAVLNAAGVVDGCLTNDGDAFLYGAVTVYRNFTLNAKDPHVESYSMVDIKQQLGLDRDKLVAMALLLGCDYLPKGVPSVGMDKAVKLMTSLQGVCALDRFREWRHMSDADCIGQIEVIVKRKALILSEFPQQNVIDEFMQVKDRCPTHIEKWRRPVISKLQVFALNKLEWPVDYTLEKVLPWITLWDMMDILNTDTQGKINHLVPNRIVKSRIRQGIQCYEVEWIRPDDLASDTDEVLVTIEEQDIFSRCFLDVVQIFEQELENKKSKPKGKRKKRDILGMDNVEDTQSHNIELSKDTQSPAVEELPDGISKMTMNGQLVKEIQEASSSLKPVTQHTNRDSYSERKMRLSGYTCNTNQEEYLTEIKPAYLTSDTAVFVSQAVGMTDPIILSSSEDEDVEYIPLSQRIKQKIAWDSKQEKGDKFHRHGNLKTGHLKNDNSVEDFNNCTAHKIRISASDQTSDKKQETKFKELSNQKQHVLTGSRTSVVKHEVDMMRRKMPDPDKDAEHKDRLVCKVQYREDISGVSEELIPAFNKLCQIKMDSEEKCNMLNLKVKPVNYRETCGINRHVIYVNSGQIIRDSNCSGLKENSVVNEIVGGEMSEFNNLKPQGVDSKSPDTTDQSVKCTSTLLNSNACNIDMVEEISLQSSCVSEDLKISELSNIKSHELDSKTLKQDVKLQSTTSSSNLLNSDDNNDAVKQISTPVSQADVLINDSWTTIQNNDFDNIGNLNFSVRTPNVTKVHSSYVSASPSNFSTFKESTPSIRPSKMCIDSPFSLHRHVSPVTLSKSHDCHMVTKTPNNEHLSLKSPSLFSFDGNITNHTLNTPTERFLNTPIDKLCSVSEASLNLSCAKSVLEFGKFYIESSLLKSINMSSVETPEKPLVEEDENLSYLASTLPTVKEVEENISYCHLSNLNCSYGYEPKIGAETGCLYKCENVDHCTCATSRVDMDSLHSESNMVGANNHVDTDTFHSESNMVGANNHVDTDTFHLESNIVGAIKFGNVDNSATESQYLSCVERRNVGVKENSNIVLTTAQYSSLTDATNATNSNTMTHLESTGNSHKLTDEEYSSGVDNTAVGVTRNSLKTDMWCVGDKSENYGNSKTVSELTEMSGIISSKLENRPHKRKSVRPNKENRMDINLSDNNDVELGSENHTTRNTSVLDRTEKFIENENSPVALADRLRMRLRTGSVKYVLGEITGN